MVQQGGENAVSIVVEAKDRASRVLRNISTTLQTRLGAAVRSAAFSMLSFTGILGAAGLSVTALTFKLRDLFQEIQATNRAAATFGLNLRLAGFSADRADAAIESLRNNLNRTAFQALPGMDEGLQSFMANLDADSLQRLDDLSGSLSEALGLEPDKMFVALAEAMMGNMQPLQDLGLAFKDFNEVVNEAPGLFQRYLEGLTALEKVWRGFRGVISFVGEVIKAGAEIFAAYDLAVISALMSVVTKLEEWRVKAVDNIRAVGESFNSIIATLNTWRANFLAIINAFNANWQKFTNAGLQVIREAWDAFVGYWIGSIKDTVNLVLAAWDFFWTFAKGRWRMFVNDIYTAIRGRLTELARDAAEWGRAVIQGIWDGMQARVTALLAQIRSWAAQIADAFRSAMRISSPSKVMMDIGEAIGQGLELGMEKSMPEMPGFSPPSSGAGRTNGGARHMTIRAGTVTMGGQVLLRDAVLEILGEEIGMAEPNLGLG